MSDERVARVLVVAEQGAVDATLLDAIRARAGQGPAQFRVVVPNPAAAEVHLLHPERHDKAAQAEAALRDALPAMEAAAGGHVIGSVSVRHDNMDVVEHVLFNEPIDEIILAVSTHRFAHWLHQDLEDRLRHYGLPISRVGVHPA